MDCGYVAFFFFLPLRVWLSCKASSNSRVYLISENCWSGSCWKVEVTVGDGDGLYFMEGSE